MKFSNIKNLLVVLLTIGAFAYSSAQSRSGYFLDNYTYGYQLNPAFEGTKGFVSVPAIGNFNLNLSSTMHLKNFIYNIDGTTTTFMNPKVPSATFLNSIPNNNQIGLSMKMGVLAVGFNSFKGFSTVSVNLVSNTNLRVPKSIFSLLKQGLENDTYDIGKFDAHADTYVEIALGHSHKINDNLRVGAAFKFLVGGANIDANFKKAHMSLGRDKWTIQTDATLKANITGLTYKTDYNETTGHRYVNGADIDNPGIGGFGVALDLGAYYKLNQDWTFSAAILDFGFISWKNNMVASTNGVRSFQTNEFTFNVDNDAPNSFNNELDRMTDKLSSLYELDDMGNQGSRERMLATTLNFGAKYYFPYYRKLSFGLLNTTRIQGKFTWTDFRLSANYEPFKIVSVAANFGYGTFGASFGWIANVKVTGFNLFVGMDHTLGKLSKQYIPLNTNAQLSFGLNAAF